MRFVCLFTSKCSVVHCPNPWNSKSLEFGGSVLLAKAKQHFSMCEYIRAHILVDEVDV